MEIYQIAALGGFTTINTAAVNEEDLLGYAIEEVVIEDEVYEFEINSTAISTFVLLLQNVIICYRTTVDAALAYETVYKKHFTCFMHFSQQ